MQIQSASTHSTASLLNIASRPKHASAIATLASSAASAATSTDRATISQAARDLFAAQATLSEDSATAVYDTNQGAITLNIDEYFTPPTNTNGGLSSLPPLLLPTQKNVDALTRHISATFPQFLKQNDIPFAPASITYDQEGKVQLPPDYPYASELKQALADNPTMARELSTVSALTSHLVEMKKSIPFQQEYAAATTQAAADAVVAKYSYLFSNNRHYDIIALQFSASGSLTLTADGEPVS